MQPSSVILTVLVAEGGGVSDEFQEIVAPFNAKYFRFSGPGRDVGAVLLASMYFNPGRFLFFGGTTYFQSQASFDILASALTRSPYLLIGPMSSYESRPHLRTCSFGTDSAILNAYPHQNKVLRYVYNFEHSEFSITDWALSNSVDVLMVTKDGSYDRRLWRLPPEIFRRGQQSNCLVLDRHSDIFSSSNEIRRLELSNAADGLSVARH